MRSKLIFAILMLALASVLVAIQIRPSPGLTARSTTVSVQSAKSDVTGPTASDLKAQVPEGTRPADGPGPADPEFQQWLSRQALQIDNAHVNPEQVQGEMDRRVKRLTRAQTRQLLETARSAHAPAAEKILSTYMLVEAGPRALEELRELIAAPLTKNGPAEPHSVDELDSVREKTLKIMAIDGLASRAQSDVSAREALAETISQVQDPSVKKYAQDQYDRISRQ